MISEREVRAAIDECLKEPMTGTKRGVLSDLIIINGYLFGDHPREGEPENMVSRSAAPPEPAEGMIETGGGSEFLDAAEGKKPERFWRLMDEFVQAVKLLHPRMHDAFIEKVRDI